MHSVARNYAKLSKSFQCTKHIESHLIKSVNKTYTSDVGKRLEEVAKEYNISHKSDWYRFPVKVIPHLFFAHRSTRNSLRNWDTNSILNTIAHRTNCYHPHILNTIGCHGSSTTLRSGQIPRLTVYLWNGRPNNFK